MNVEIIILITSEYNIMVQGTFSNDNNNVRGILHVYQYTEEAIAGTTVRPSQH